MALTTAQVSAIIAAIIFILQFIIPNAVVLILVGILRPTHSAVTWSVVQRNLFSSHWPLITNSDSTANRGVDAKVRFITFLKPIGLFLISLAAVITPLGLHDTVMPSIDSDHVPFTYLTDPGPFGYASMPREGQRFTRWCGAGGMPLSCPGSQTRVTDYDTNILGYHQNATLIPGTTYDMNVPQSLIDLYQSGLSTQPGSVASFFDIESRLFYTRTGPKRNNGEKYIVSTFKMLQSAILDNTIRPIEGLIIDSRNGGVGVRNHTIPEDIDLGAEWDEDILFIEPETECVNLNITYEFVIGDAGSSKFFNEDPVFVDEGGFVNLNQAEPLVDMSNPQKNANLRDRAYHAAWITNFVTMLYMNVTSPSPNRFAYLNSTFGQRFPVESMALTKPSANSIDVRKDFSTIVDAPILIKSDSNDTYGYNYSYSSGGPSYTNPFNIIQDTYKNISTICSGGNRTSLANGTNIHIECGLVVGAARPADGSPIPVIPLPGTKWRQSLYACASATRASIKQVTFHFNASLTRDISSLSIINTTKKVYPNEASMPRWGIETGDFQVSELPQLWGLISEDNANATNLTSFKAPFLRLPGSSSNTLANQVADDSYIPGHNAPSQALSAIYEGVDDMYDYTGDSSIAMMQRWRQLENSTEGVAHIVNLIWTDIAANQMTSGKNWNQKPNRIQKRTASGSDSNDYVSVPVTKFERRVQYKWAYAVPALIVLALGAVVVLTAIILSAFKHSGIHHVRHYTDSLSSGRLLAAAQFPGIVDKLAPTKLWINSIGKHQVSLGRMTIGKYQQAPQSLSPPPPPPPAPKYAVPQFMPMQQGPDSTEMYQSQYTYGGYQPTPAAEGGYIGWNAATRTEKSNDLPSSVGEEISLTPLSDGSNSSYRGYMRVNNS